MHSKPRIKYINEMVLEILRRSCVMGVPRYEKNTLVLFHGRYIVGNAMMRLSIIR
jgi:hypothetical protein